MKKKFTHADTTIHEIRRIANGKLKVTLTAVIYGKKYDYIIDIDDATPKYDFRLKSDMQLFCINARYAVSEKIFNH